MQQEERVTAKQSGRIDKILAALLGQSRNQVEKLIREGLVSVAGKTVSKSSQKIEAGTEIVYRFLEAEPREQHAIDFDVEILYEDEDLLVVNKPSGIVVHPAPSVKGATLVDWLIARGVSLSTISGEERHGIVHRIDKETTGALVVAKNNESHQLLSAQLERKEMGRYYLALIDQPLKENRLVEHPIGRNPHNRLKMAVIEGGRAAKTAFARLAEGRNGTALIAAKLFSGRTHQIRVHLESLSRHILGDTLYGYKSKKGKIPRVYLHAYLLYLTHPRSGKKLEIAAPLFADMQAYLNDYYDKGEIDEKIRPERIPHIFGDSAFSA